MKSQKQMSQVHMKSCALKNKNLEWANPRRLSLPNQMPTQGFLRNKTSVKFATLPQPLDKDCQIPQQASLH